MQICGRRFDTGEPVRIETDGKRIVRVTPLVVEAGVADTWPWLAPGLIDIQVNGYGGQEFSSPDLTPEKVGAIVRAYDAFGVTRCCPTLTTNRLEVLAHAVRTIDQACRASPETARRIAGIHLEGPYISPEDGPRGAHPAESCRRPDWDEFQRLQEAAGGRIRVLTMSVEFYESAEFVRRATESGVLVAIGHTAADPAHVRWAVDAGARLSTHLGNGSHPLLHRHRNYVWEQLAEDRLMASLIVDGYHLPPAVVKTFVRAKTPGRCILVSDLSGLAGLAPGRYPSGLSDVEILPSGKLVLAGQEEYLAGGPSPVGEGIVNVMRFADVDLGTAVRMASDHPARMLGVESGELKPEGPADLVQFDLADLPDDAPGKRFRVRATIARGETVWGDAWAPAD